eukprot:891921-Amphidinium_carterae.1
MDLMEYQRHAEVQLLFLTCLAQRRQQAPSNIVYVVNMKSLKPQVGTTSNAVAMSLQARSKVARACGFSTGTRTAGVDEHN